MLGINSYYKVLLLAAIFRITNANEAAKPCPTSPTAPDCTILPAGSFVTDTLDCNKYYTCSNGNAIPGHCEDGLWFDDKRSVCNFPHLVDCPNFGFQPEISPSYPTEASTDSSTQSTPSEPTSETSTQSTPTEASPDSSTQSDTPTASSDESTESTIQSEPSTDSTQTTTPSESSTGSSSPSTARPCPSGPTAPDCTILPAGSFVTDTIDCNKYYTCSNGNAIPGHCEDGLWFDDNRNVCNFPQLVDCPNFGCQPEISPSYPTEASTDSSTQSTPSEPTSETSTQSPPTEASPDSSTQSDTPTASSDESTESTIPSEPSEPSTDSTQTTTPSESSTGSSSPSTNRPCPSGPTAPDCTILPDGSFVTDKIDCNKYYTCSNGNAIPWRCEAGLWFDDKLNACNFPQLVECPHFGCKPGTSPTYPTEASADSSTPPTPSEPTSETTTQSSPTEASPNSSTQSDTPTASSDEFTESTIPSEPSEPSTDSTQTTTPSESSTGSSTHSTARPCPSGPTAPDCTILQAGSFVTDTIDCNKYYTCSNGNAIPGHCEDGLWFDDKRNVCNFPQLVDCPNFGCQPETSPSYPTEASTDSSTQSTPSEPTSETLTQSPPTEASPDSSTQSDTPTASSDESTESTIQSEPSEPSTDSTQTTTPSESSTGSSSPSTARPCPSGPTAPDCTILPAGSFVTDTLDCNKYYTCSNGNAIPGHCEDGLWFDDKRSVCNYPQLVDCPNFGCQPEISPSYPTEASTDSSTQSTPSEPTSETSTQSPPTEASPDSSTQSDTPTASSDESTESTIPSEPSEPSTDSTQTTTPSESSTGSSSPSTTRPCPSGPTAPDCTILPDGSFVTDKIDCNKYYTCSNGKAIPWRCEAGLWFDDKLNACNFPQLVECPHFGCKPGTSPTYPTEASTDSSTPPTPSEPTSETTTQSAPTEASPNSSTQSDTPTASSDESTESTIPSEPFEPSTDSTQTTTPSESSTGSSTQSTARPCPSGPTAPDCTILPAGSFVTDTIDCNKYYTCSNGNAIPGHCEDGLWFDDKRNVCNFPQLVDCPNFGCQPEISPSYPTEASTDSSTPSTPSEPTSETSTQSPPTEASPDSSTQSDTPTASSDESTESTIPSEPSELSTDSTQTTTPSESSTGSSSPSTARPCPSGPTAPDCTILPAGSFVTDTIDCNKYYTCSNGNAIPGHCEDGLWFDDKRNVCNFPQLVDCPNFGCQQETSPSYPTDASTDSSTPTTPSEPTAETTTQSSPTEASPDSSTQSETPTAPSDESTESTIPSEPSSDSTQTTTPSESSTGSSSPSTTRPCPSGPTSPDCTILPDGSFVTDTIDCNKYYTCSNGNAIPGHCEEGLWFDDKRSVCNFPHLVDCPNFGCQPEISPSYPIEASTDSSTPSTPLEPTAETTTQSSPTEASPDSSTQSETPTAPSDESTESTIPSEPSEPSSDSTQTTTPSESSTGSSSPSTTRPCPSGPTSPDCTILPAGSFVTDTIDCNKYYTCSNGKAILWRCEAGLWFDDKRNVCNFPQLVDCPHFGCQPEISPSYPTDASTDSSTQSTPSEPTSETSTQSPPTEASPDSSAQSDTPTASADESTESTIPTEPSQPSTDSTQTTTTSESSTRSSTPITTRPCPSGPTSPDCTLLPAGSFVTDTIDCNKYYTCSNGKAIPWRCEAGLWFDDKLSACNFPQLVECPYFGCDPERTLSKPALPMQSSTKATTLVPTQPSTNQSRQSTIPDNRGRPCPSGPTAPDCTNLPPGSFSTDLIDCNKYYRCRNGLAVASRCQKGLWFDDKRLHCNLPAFVQCPYYGCQL